MRSPLIRFISFFCCFLFDFQTEGQQPDTIENDGKASFYHDNLSGMETSNGDIYNLVDFTAAHRTLPFNSFLLVTDKETGKNTIVRVNDRGPFVKSRIIDLSRAAATKLGMMHYGVIPVKIQVLSLLDYLPMNDSLFNDGDNWNCYGKKSELSAPTVFIWGTEYWKHAFYMATSLSLDYHLDSVIVHVSGNLVNRKYLVMATGVQGKRNADALIRQFRQDGFLNAGKYKLQKVKPATSLSTRPPIDQLAK